MKKFTDFVIEKRHYILVLFIVLAIVCGYLSTLVKVNRDMSLYLPKDSETRKGNDIMEEEFPNENESSLNVMFTNITDEEKIAEELRSIPNVSEVTTDKKDEYTLFTLTVSAKADSKEAKQVFDEVNSKYDNIDLSGDINDENKDILPVWIVALAIFCGLIILIIMCDSYIEPFLFLFAILLAVVFNKGTNIIFSSVSSITNAIAAILQLALSMDYSIMLINRYRQEKEKNPDKVEAMKNALYGSFATISSSSITTIVGLLALVFMSFTIGRDLGIVLAKGVLFSLISVFFCLPSLILMFDKLIIKFKKKSPKFKLDGLGKIVYKFRYAGVAIFVIIFSLAFVFKNYLNIKYTDSETDIVKETFTPTNQFAIIYPKEKEELIEEYTPTLENNENITEVLALNNTIEDVLPYNELNDKLEDTTIDDYLLKILYYHYFNEKEDNKINLNDFLSFIQDNVYNNEKLNKEVTKEIKNNITKLENFTNKKLITKKHTSKEIADMFLIKENTLNNLLIYYNSLNTKTTLTIKEFMDFVNKNYPNEVPKDILPFLDTNALNKELDYITLSKYFNMDEETVKNIYLYYLNTHELPKLTINEVVSLIDKEELASVKTFSNKEFITSKKTKKEMATIFNLNPEEVAYLYQDNDTLTPYEFINILVKVKNTEEINKLYLIMDSTINDKTYSYDELALVLGIDAATLKNVYILHELPNLTFTPIKFVDFILTNKDILNIDKETTQSLTKLQTIIKATINNTKYNYTDLSNILGISKENTKLIYGAIDTSKKETKLSYQEFINFLINDCLTNKTYAASFNEDKITKITTLNEIINDSLNNKKYGAKDMLTKLKKLDDVDSSLVELLYMYYGSVNDYNDKWTISLSDFVKYLNEDIINDKRFDDYISKETKNNIIEAKDTVSDAREKLSGENYNRLVINSNYPVESDETFDFITKTKNDLNDKDIYLIGNSLVGYEISNNFQNELNLITFLTILFIFIVVAITFKKIFVPIFLVLIIQGAVYLTMSLLTIQGGSVYFMALLIVQCILMGATIDYAILYTSYYMESRQNLDIKESLINAYNKSIHTILTSASILTLVTLVVGYFGSAITGKICITISEGTIASTILTVFLLPNIIAAFDKLFIKKK